MSSFGAGAKPRRDSARTNRADNDESQQPDPPSGPKGVHTMRSRNLRGTGIASATVGLILAAGLLAQPPRAQAKQEIRDAFFLLYPNALGTTIDTVPSHPDHCGVCHFRFRGGGTRNPYGLRVEDVIGNFPNTEQGRMDAIESVELEDPDGDGYTSLTEITDTLNFANTPTFPGLTPANVGNVTDVDIADIQDYLVPTTGGDVTPPDVTLIAPNGGEILVGNAPTTVAWTATDASGVSGVSLYVSLEDGLTYEPIAIGLTNSGSHTWFPANRPTTLALIKIEAVDNAFNIGVDTSDAVFDIVSPSGGLVPTTLRDFDMPGSQPFEAGILNPPGACTVCHGDYDPAVEPGFNWKGSMMSQSSHDPLFAAAMTIANQDAPDSGDLCLRCHISRGWLRGRSVPTDGTQMLDSDRIGIACDLCHRLVDPIPSPENPAEDTAILADLRLGAPTVFGVGMFVVDPTGARRGPFVDADSGHPILVSPYHREAALCGTCHDVSNPAFEKDGNGNYVPNAFDEPAASFAAHVIAPVERTYSEWFFSEYNTPEGVYAPQFGGNLAFVATCQDCHLRDVTGQGCNSSPPIRDDLPLHDMTGGSTWLPTLLPTLHPGNPLVDLAALQAGADRALYMLQNAADLSAAQSGRTLTATVVNNTGHKLPTGYPEGRRMWLNVRFYDADQTLIGESAAYDMSTGELSHDPDAKIYEILPVTAGVPGVPDGTEFHFALNNDVAKDNRIPPRGFTNAAFADFGGAPVGHSYADGQYWDDTAYAIPAAATSVELTLYYQSTSKEFVEFLRDENFTDSTGQEIYDLWNNNGKCPPEVMAQVQIDITPPIPGDLNDDGYVDATDFGLFADCLSGPGVTPLAGCDLADLDADGDVDLHDAALFALNFTGPDTLAPAAPTNLTASAGTDTIALDWDDNGEPDLAGYNVFRATASGGPYTPLNGALLPTSDYVDTDVMTDVTYYYVVTAVDINDNESAASDEASATPLGALYMHVASIVLSVDNQGGGTKYAVATVTIHDAQGAPVAAADVTGTFVGQAPGTYTETTDAAGVAVLISGPFSGNEHFTFCVDDVVHATLAYDPDANQATCASYP
jgi:hypothetical protein